MELGVGAEVVEAGIVLEVDDPNWSGPEGWVEEDLGLLLVDDGDPGGAR
jgi:hypothetical protein